MYHCKACGHHINLDKDGVGYCPICDKKVVVKDDIIDFLLDMLEEEHTGMGGKTKDIIKEKFGVVL